jgi:hypothetical protein
LVSHLASRHTFLHLHFSIRTRVTDNLFIHTLSSLYPTNNHHYRGTFWGAPNAGGYYAEGGGCCYNSPTAAIQFWRAFKIDVLVQ